MSKHEITLKELHEIMEHAKDYLVAMPTRAGLPGMSRILTENERLVLAYVGGAYTLAGRFGIDTKDLVVKYETPDLSPIED
jgi:hypothetical protein